MRRLLIMPLLFVATVHAQNYSLDRVPKFSGVYLCIEAGNVLRDKDVPANYKEAILNKLMTTGTVKLNEFGDIINNRTRIGASMCSALASFGYPIRQNTTVTARGTRIQLVYERDYVKYVYIENDVVTAWQQ